jgi:hypothetical protein
VKYEIGQFKDPAHRAASALPVVFRGAKLSIAPPRRSTRLYGRCADRRRRSRSPHAFCVVLVRRPTSPQQRSTRSSDAQRDARSGPPSSLRRAHGTLGKGGTRSLTCGNVQCRGRGRAEDVRRRKGTHSLTLPHLTAAQLYNTILLLSREGTEGRGRCRVKYLIIAFLMICVTV